MTAPRVMHVLPSLETGGTQESVRGMVDGMPDIPTAVVAINAGGDYQPLFEQRCPTFVMAHETGDPYRRYSWFKPGPIHRLVRVMKEFEPNIVQTYTFSAATVGRAAAKLAGVPVIIDSLLSTYTWKDEKALRIDGFLGRWTDRITCVSHAVKDYAVKQNPRIPPEKYSVIYNGIDTNQYHPRDNRVAVLGRFGIPPDRLVVGSVSRLVRMKRTRDLIAAAPELLQDFPNVHFLIAGDGPAVQELVEQAAGLGLRQRFTFTGTVPDTENVFPALDVFVQTSEREGFGLSVAEAMASGTAVAAANTGGIPELVHHNHNGLLFEVGDVRGLSDAVHSLLLDHERRKRLGAQAAHDIAKGFHVSQTTDGHRSLWGELLQAKQGSL